MLVTLLSNSLSLTGRGRRVVFDAAGEGTYSKVGILR